MKMSESLKQAISCFVFGIFVITVLPLTVGCVFAAKEQETEQTAPVTNPPVTEVTVLENVVWETTTATQQPEKTTTTAPVAEEIAIPQLASQDDIELIARVIWGEAGYIKNKAEQAAVAWTILNRVDLWGKDIETTVKSPFQFFYENGGTKPVPLPYVELAADVVIRWEREHAGETDVGRVLPADYLFYVGDGEHNHFSKEWQSQEFWDWSLPSPYEMEAE